ncbi:MAG TPA: PilZ domain-containing protein [Candidatus Omnitrophota bacterium]|jgi:hypothetical protein|nr:PilZ domain-containing protein [Candidatus Omnitrophota bacterium]
MNNKSDQRLFPRVKLKEPLHYRTRGVSDYNYTLLEDISLGGLAFLNSRYMPPQTQLTMEIKLLSKVLRPIGKVVWTSPVSHSDRFKTGISFIEFDDNEKKFLSEYITMKTHQEQGA